MMAPRERPERLGTGLDGEANPFGTAAVFLAGAVAEQARRRAPSSSRSISSAARRWRQEETTVTPARVTCAWHPRHAEQADFAVTGTFCMNNRMNDC